MSIYKPTFLYIKQHKVTGLLYFGKTVNRNPLTYKGSGKHWVNHYNKHGKEHIETLWYCLFTDMETLVEFATTFSVQQNIVDSTIWANMEIENGLDGGYVDETSKQKSRNRLLNKKMCKDRNGNILLIDQNINDESYRGVSYGVKRQTHTRELMSMQRKGTSTYKDKNGNKLRLSNKDIRVLSGEFVGIRSTRFIP